MVGEKQEYLGKMKRYLTVFIIALAMLGITAEAYCYNAEVVEDIIPREVMVM